MSKNDRLYEVQFDVVLYEQVEGAELDELWSFVHNKANQRWLWLAINHDTGDILAYTFGKCKDEVFTELQNILKPFGITMYYTDNWGSYQRKIPAENHTIGKKNTQTIGDYRELSVNSRYHQ